jgi:hypothetical protein
MCRTAVIAAEPRQRLRCTTNALHRVRDTASVYVPGFSTSAAQSHMKFVPMVMLSTWQ